MRPQAAVLLGVVLIACAGCGDAVDAQELATRASSTMAERTTTTPKEMRGSAPLTLLDAPPVEPPPLSINAVTVPVLSQTWVNSEELIIQSPNSESANGLPKIAGDDWVTIDVDSATRPVAFEVYSFTDTSVSGVPTGQPRMVDCLVKPACTVKSTPAGLRVDLAINQETTVVVVFIDYALRMQDIENAAVEGYSVNRATWGVRIGHETSDEENLRVELHP